MKRRLLTYLVCPKCSGDLVYTTGSQQGECSDAAGDPGLLGSDLARHQAAA